MKDLMKILLATVIFAGFVGFAESATITIPGDYGTISDAVGAAHANDTILVRNGVYRGETNCLIRFPVALTLLSEEGPAECILDAEGTPDTVGFTMATGSKISGFTFTRFTHNAILASSVNNIRITNCFFFANVNRSNNMGGQVRLLTAQDAVIEHCIFQENACGSAGAGIHLNTTTVRAKIWDCIFIQNETTKYGGGIAVISNSTADIGNCIFTGNFVQIDGGAVSFTLSSSGTVRNCTFINNAARNGGGGGLYKGSNSNPVVINSIFWENAAGTGQQLWQQNTGNGAGGEITISYCCVQGGENEESGWTGEHIIEDAPWFAEGREPLWGLNFYYLDPEQSSCIDVGSADASEVGMDTLITDPSLEFDEGRVDLGFHYDMDSYLRIGDLRGYVLSALNGMGVWGCRVTTSGRRETACEESGFWRIDDHRMGDLWINFHHEAFIDTTITGLFLEENEELDIRLEMLHTEFTPSIQNWTAVFDSGTVASTQFMIANGGSGVLQFTATPQLVGHANVEPWTLRETFPAATTCEDNRLNGVFYLDSLFYVTGANDADSNLVYILNREGALIDSFTQFGHSNYGMKGLTYGGDIIWGSEADSVFGYDRDGTLLTVFETPVNPIENIAYDSDRDVLWLSGISSDFVAVNRDGSDPGLAFTDMNLNRKYGMVYWPEDPDGKCLYFIYRHMVNGQNNRHFVFKVNPDEPQDTVRVAELFVDGNPQMQSACIAKWDLFSIAFITLVNIAPEFGGDRIEVYQLAGNASWMSVEPAIAEVMPQDQLPVTLSLDLPGFPVGRYEGQIFFTHNALDNQFTLPIVATLRHNDVAVEPEILPVSTAIESIHPNPFNGSTTLKYAVSTSGVVKLAIYDLAGREITRLMDSEELAGNHAISIDANSWASGVYIVKLETAGEVRTAKMVLMR